MAFEILVFALFKEVKQKKREKRVKTARNSDDESDDETVVTTARSLLSRPSTGARESDHTGATSSRMSQLLDNMALDDNSSVATSRQAMQSHAAEEPSSSRDVAVVAALTGDRFEQFKAQLYRVKSSLPQEDPINLNDLSKKINGNDVLFTLPEVLATIKHMSDNNIGVWYQEELDAMLFI
jgi:hypothetical protein